MFENRNGSWWPCKPPVGTPKEELLKPERPETLRFKQLRRHYRLYRTGRRLRPGTGHPPG